MLKYILIAAVLFGSVVPVNADSDVAICIIKLSGKWRTENYWPEDLALPSKVIMVILSACK